MSISEARLIAFLQYVSDNFETSLGKLPQLIYDPTEKTFVACS